MTQDVVQALVAVVATVIVGGMIFRYDDVFEKFYRWCKRGR
jgi:hypothetical protein